MALQTMHDLLIEQLQDLLNAERQVGAALPRLLHSATNDHLADVLRARMLQVEARVDRLTVILESLDVAPRSTSCRAMEGVVLEGVDLVMNTDEDRVLDAGLVAQAQRMEHHLVSGYATSKAMAHHLSRERVARVLFATIQEQAKLLRTLGDLAEYEVNPRAALAGTEMDSYA